MHFRDSKIHNFPGGMQTPLTVTRGRILAPPNLKFVAMRLIPVHYALQTIVVDSGTQTIVFYYIEFGLCFDFDL